MTGTVDPAASARGRSAKNRGKSYERQFAGWLVEQGWPEARRAVVTGMRAGGHLRHDPGDIAGTPGIVWDVKQRAFDLARRRVEVEWMLLAVEAMRVGEAAKFGFLVERLDRRPVSEWRVWMTADRAVRLLTGQPGPNAGYSTTAVAMAATDVVALLHVRGYGSPVNPFEDGAA